MNLKTRLNQLTPYFFIAPAVLIMGTACFYPVLHSMRLSFFDWSLGTPWLSREFLGLDNYVRIFTDPSVYTSLQVTLMFAGAVVAAELILGMALAFLVERGLRGLAVFRTIFILPMMIAPVVVGLIWRYLYDTRFGLINYFLRQIGLEPQLWLASPDLALPGIIIADIWQWTPFIFIIILAGLQSLPASTMDAARVDGCRQWQIIWYIKLPLLLPVITVALLLRLIDAFRVLEVIFIMTFGGPGLTTEVLSLHIYKTAFLSQRLGMASAIANFLLIIILTLSVILLFIANPAKAARSAR
ncbi:MAG: sugar ABC transporter permease [Desulfobacterales bacterium]|nr:MAG: sugar ABC transporter permease [Desulfobacterales bacterium]